MKCPFCAEEIRDEAIRCKHCQADVSRGVCIACGKRNRLEAKFCRFCGSQNLFDTDYIRAKAEAKMLAEYEKVALKEIAAWKKAEDERRAAGAKLQLEAKAEAEARAKAEAEARAEAKAKADAEARARTEAAIRAKAEAIEKRRQELLCDMVLIQAGEFYMGSEKGKPRERPRHKVYLDAYYIDKYPVTVAKYEAFCSAAGRKMPKQPSWSSDRHPVVNVNWDDADAYCKWAGKRLPTEAEWEKAARGGADTRYSFGDNAMEVGFLGFGGRDILGEYALKLKTLAKAISFGCRDILGEYAWYHGNSEDHAHPVGQKKPNQFGLYDMAGNVLEWVADWYDEAYYKNSPERNPKGPEDGKERVLRGGAWNYYAHFLRSFSRFRVVPSRTSINIGFRCCLSADSV